jgi:hypothetical protein
VFEFVEWKEYKDTVNRGNMPITESLPTLCRIVAAYKLPNFLRALPTNSFKP